MKTKRTDACPSSAHRPCAQAETTHGGFSRSTIFQGLLRSHWGLALVLSGYPLSHPLRFGASCLCYAERATSLKGFPWPLCNLIPVRSLPFSAGQLTPMQAIEARHAVRSYTDESLAPEAMEALREAIAR